MNELFRKFAHAVSEAAGSPWAFLLAFLTIMVWAISGPFFRFSETWQLVINTGTTIVTFLMIFLVQNAQNRDAKATHIKLDELIHAQKRAHNTIMGIEEQSDKHLKKAKKDVDKEMKGKVRTKR